MHSSPLVLVGCSSGETDESAADTAEDKGASTVLVDPAEFVSFVESNPDAPVVNVHVPYEGHIEGTDAFVPFEEIGDWDGLPEDRSEPVVLYCRSGRMSAIAADTLTKMGYTAVMDLDGGMNAWTDTGNGLLRVPPGEN
ncbi:MAG: rhodanese-like domain-containing protein [Microthrixaceae bacterium]|nr:rhodanese-like domain-containing protein [Microthrixaceae bacterium]